MTNAVYKLEDAGFDRKQVEALTGHESTIAKSLGTSKRIKELLETHPFDRLRGVLNQPLGIGHLASMSRLQESTRVLENLRRPLADFSSPDTDHRPMDLKVPKHPGLETNKKLEHLTETIAAQNHVLEDIAETTVASSIHTSRAATITLYAVGLTAFAVLVTVGLAVWEIHENRIMNAETSLILEKVAHAVGEARLSDAENANQVVSALSTILQQNTVMSEAERNLLQEMINQLAAQRSMK